VINLANPNQFFLIILTNRPIFVSLRLRASASIYIASTAELAAEDAEEIAENSPGCEEPERKIN
jgi:hypothetical protein